MSHSAEPTAEEDPALAEPPAPRAVSPRSRTRAIAIAAVIAVLATAAIAFSTGRLSAIGEPVPTTTGAEAGFSRDMQTHHNQGVELSLIVRDLTEDAPVRLLAYDILTTQGAQSGMMSGWLSVWGLPQAPREPSMTWMTRAGVDGASHDHSAGADAEDPTARAAAPVHRPGDPMPGLATPAQIDHLRSLSGVAAEREFLTLMIAHHEGAIDMARAVLERTRNPVVRTFAESVVASQRSEIDLMTGMLAERAGT